MVVLSLECSTSAAKALVIDTMGGGQWLCSENFSSKAADGVTQDAKAGLAALLRCGRKAVETSGKKVEAVALVSTWHSLLLCDENGEPQGRIRLWSDLESSELAAEYAKDSRLKQMVYERTGCVLHATYPVWKYAYLLKKGLIGQNLSIYSHGEFLFEYMTGVRAVSLNIASGSGFLNLHTKKWDEEMLRLSGAKIGQFGEICPENFSRPLNENAARELGVTQGIPVYAGGADGAMTQFGCGALDDGIMTMSVGTSGALRAVFSEPALSKSMSTWCYCLTDGKYLAGAATNGAGNCVNRFTTEQGKSAHELDMQLEGGDFSGAPVFLPFIFGERSPGYAEKPHGGFFPSAGEVKESYYAVLEGILFNLFQCYTELNEAGGEPEEIRLSGGIVNSPVWLQMCADVFGREIHASEMQHASLLGGVVIAAGQNGENFGKTVFQSYRTVKPRADKSNFYRERYKKYLYHYLRDGNDI